jgi:hypothetical protein
VAYIGRIKRPVRGLILPGGTPSIDWSNPITAGLVGCWVTRGEGGANPVIRDLVTQIKLTATNGATAASVVGGSPGLVAKDNGASYWSALAPVSQRPVKAFTMLWFGSILGTTTLTPELFAEQTIPGGSHMFGLYRNGNATGLNLITNNGGASVIIAGTGFFSGATPATYCALGSITSGGTAFIYRNGSLFTSAAAGTVAISSDATSTILVGTNKQAGAYPNAGMSVSLLWNRQLSPGESALISADPTNFLVFPGDLPVGLLGGKTSQALLAALAEAAAAVDSISTTAQFQSAISESAAAIDAISAAAQFLASISESTSAADVTTAQAAFASALTETGSAADTTTATAQFLSALAEAGAATDTLTGSAGYTASLTAPAAATDAVSAAVDLIAALTEAASAADVVTAAAGYLATITEAAAAGDAIATSQQLLASLVEAANATDSISATQQFLAALAESATASDAIAATQAFVASLTETASADDLITASAAYLASLVETSATLDAIAATRGLLADLVEAVIASDLWSVPGPPPIVKLARVIAAIRMASAALARRLQPSAPATRIVSVPAMANAEPIDLDLMRAGTTDTRGLDLYPALKLESDTVVSITSVTVVRTDGQTIVPADLTITPAGFSAPWISANGDVVPKPNTAVNWWQQVGPSIAALGDVQYRITVAFVTTAGRPLEYDAYQTVTATLG